MSSQKSSFKSHPCQIDRRVQVLSESPCMALAFPRHRHSLVRSFAGWAVAISRMTSWSLCLLCFSIQHRTPSRAGCVLHVGMSQLDSVSGELLQLVASCLDGSLAISGLGSQ